MLVVDASVIVKWYIDEHGSDFARLLLTSEDLLVAPAHAVAEIGHVLVRHVRAGALPQENMADALAGLSRTVSPIPLGALHAEAITVALGTGASFYDALYVSAAIGWNTRLVTADIRLARMLADTPWTDRIVALPDWAHDRLAP